MKRGEVWWADMPEPSASEPGYRRPVLILQTDEFNRSRINTVVVAAITSNINLGLAPGNVTLAKKSTGLNRESVVNVSQIVTLDKMYFDSRVGKVPIPKMLEVEAGIRLVLGL